MTCPDCQAAASAIHHGFASGCQGCKARSLARIFIGKGEHGRRYRMALAQLEVTDEQVRAAHRADVMGQEVKP